MPKYLRFRHPSFVPDWRVIYDVNDFTDDEIERFLNLLRLTFDSREPVSYEFAVAEDTNEDGDFLDPSYLELSEVESKHKNELRYCRPETEDPIERRVIEVHSRARFLVGVVRPSVALNSESKPEIVWEKRESAPRYYLRVRRCDRREPSPSQPRYRTWTRPELFFCAEGLTAGEIDLLLDALARIHCNRPYTWEDIGWQFISEPEPPASENSMVAYLALRAEWDKKEGLIANRDHSISHQVVELHLDAQRIANSIRESRQKVSRGEATPEAQANASPKAEAAIEKAIRSLPRGATQQQVAVEANCSERTVRRSKAGQSGG